MEGEKVKTNLDREKVKELQKEADLQKVKELREEADLSYLSINRHFDTTRKLYLKLLLELENHEGGEVDRMRIDVWHKLAGALRIQGEYQQALEFYNRVADSPALARFIEINGNVPLAALVDLGRAECAMHLRDKVDREHLAGFDKEVQKMIFKGIEGTKKTQYEGPSYLTMAEFLCEQNRFDFALPWAKKAVDLAMDLAPLDSDVYNVALTYYFWCLQKTNDLPSALKVAQDRVDYWMHLEETAQEHKMIVRSQENAGEWLRCIAEVHFALGNQKLVLRYAELGKKEMLKTHADVASVEQFGYQEVTPGDLRICSNCFKTGNRMFQCKKCHSEFYCNAECQLQRWPGHRSLCKKLKKKKQK
jgi:tetratricopeptide (TPR) repeat protein